MKMETKERQWDRNEDVERRGKVLGYRGANTGKGKVLRQRHEDVEVRGEVIG